VGAALRAAREEGVRCAVFGGRVEATLPDADVRALSGDPARAAADLEALGEDLGRELAATSG
jgi:hypothetical protein